MNWIKLLKDVVLPLAKVLGEYLLKKIIRPWTHRTYEEMLRTQITIYDKKLDDKAISLKKVEALRNKIKTLNRKLARRTGHDD